MKKIIALFLALGSISAFASSEDRMPYCWVNGEKGHIEFSLVSKPVDSGKPFGVIVGADFRKTHSLSLSINGQETVIEFNGTLSIIQRDGNLVCLRR